MTKPGFTVHDLVLFVDVFGLDFVTAASEFIRSLLSSLEPKLNDNGLEESDKFKEATGEARKTISALAAKMDDEDLVKLLLEILDQTNPYNYEVLRFLMDTLEVKVIYLFKYI